MPIDLNRLLAQIERPKQQASRKPAVKPPPSAKPPAAKPRSAMQRALEYMLEGMFDGMAVAYHGRREPPRFNLDLGGAVYQLEVKGAVTGTARFKGTVSSGVTRGEGLYFSSGDDLRRTQLPGVQGEAGWDQALVAFAKARRPEIEARIKESLLDAPFRLYSEAFGRNSAEVDEWGLPQNVRLTLKFGEPKATRWQRYLPFTAHLSFTAKRKAPVTERPLSKLVDQELDVVIEEVMGPEFVYADGEIPKSQMPARRRTLRAQFKAKSPRQQMQIWKAYLEASGGEHPSKALRWR